VSFDDRVQKKAQKESPFFTGGIVAALDAKQKHAIAIPVRSIIFCILALKCAIKVNPGLI
jgi:hypothetical protein